MSDLYLAEFTDVNHTIRYTLSSSLHKAIDELATVSEHTPVRNVWVDIVDVEQALKSIYGEEWWDNYTEEDVLDDMIKLVCYDDCIDEVEKYIKDKYKGVK